MISHPGKHPGIGSRGVERRLQPFDASAFDRHHVETTWRRGAVIAQEMMRREHDAALLGMGNTARRAPERRALALAHLDEHQRAIAIAQDEIDFAASGSRTFG